MERITMREVARLAGVSVTTVSRALNKDPEISPETREKVLRVCRETGYRTNLLARSLSSSRSGVIAVILPKIENPFHAALSLQIELCARERGYQILLCRRRPKSETVEALIGFLSGEGVDGVLLPSGNIDECALLARSSALPSVLIGGSAPEESTLRLNSVSTDNYMGGRMAASYLRRLGHRQVAYLGFRQSSYTHILRHRGFLEGAGEVSLSPEGMPEEKMEVRTLVNPTGESTLEVGLRLGRELFARPLACTAVFAATDTIALGVMQAADEAGVRIPEDCSLMGYDNIDYAALPKIRLTTVSHSVPDLARMGVRLLLEQIEDPRPGEYVRRLLTPHVVERSTCAPALPGA